MSEFLKPEKYSPEFQAEVEKRNQKPIINVETITKKNEEGEEEKVNIIDIAGVRVESFAPKEEIESEIEEIHPTAETLELLQAMAETYQQKRGLIVEGETSRSKTFSFNKFTKMIFGKEAVPVDFYCNGQTDTMSLMSKWVPKTEDPEDEGRWNQWVESEEGKKEFSEIIKIAGKGNTDSEEIKVKFTNLRKKAGLSKPISQWKFQYGALPRAMTMNEKGNFLHIQEVGLAETQVIDALLQLGGKKGKLAGEIQLWEDGGRRIKTGDNFWIYYSTNPPEDFPDRSGLDQALVRRNTFLKLGSESTSSLQLKQHRDNNIPYEKIPEQLKEEVEKKQQEIIFPMEKGGDYNSPEYIDTRLLVTEAVSDFHLKLKIAMKEKSIEQRTKQKFELTDDEWNMVYSFLSNFQSSDLEATLDRAVSLHYISRFTDQGKEKAWQLWEQIKKQKDFKERLQEALPKKEQKMEDIEEISEFNEFLSEFEEEIETIRTDIKEGCS